MVEYEVQKCFYLLVSGLGAKLSGGVRGVRGGLKGLVRSDRPFRGDLRTSQKGFFFL